MNNQVTFNEATKNWRLLVAVDIVVYTYINFKLKVLLVRRKFEPRIGKWAIPGGFVREDESLEQAAIRELNEETGLKQSSYLEQLYTFGDVDRDPRGRVISVSYIHLINNPEKIQLKAFDDAEDAQWFSFDELPELSFGKSHSEILEYSKKRLRWKFQYTNIALSLLPEKFTLSELQKLYEEVFDSKMDKRNFRKKILSIDFVKETDQFKQEKGRPAKLFKMATNEIKIFANVVS